MTYELPDNLTPEGFGCVKIYYPKDIQYLRAVLSAVSYLQNWYAWKRDDNKGGKIAAAQFRLAYGLTIDDILAGKTCGPDDGTDQPPCPGQLEEQLLGGGILVEGEDDMGQVVTDVTIEGGKIRVWFGPCCYHDLGDASALGNTDDQTADVPDSLQPDVTGFARPCQKAYTITHHLFTMLDLMIQSVLATNPSIYPFSQLKAAYPDVSFDTSDLLVAVSYTIGLELSNFGFLADFNETVTQLYICRLAAAFEDTWGISSAEFDAMKSAANAELSEAQSRIVNAMINAVGRGDWNKLALSGAADQTERNCDCPGVVYPDAINLPAEATWAYNIDFTAIDGGFANAETGHGWTLGRGWYSDNIVRDNVGGGNWTLARPQRNSDATGSNRKLLYLKQWHGETPVGATHYRNPAEARIGGTVLGGYNQFPIPLTFELNFPGGGMTWGNNTALSLNWQCTFDTGEISGNMTVTRLVIAGTGTPPYANLTNILA